jgi:type IV secretory pathway VirB2 component (pilin)
MPLLKREAYVVAATVVIVLATAATASARLIDQFPRYSSTAPRPIVRETVVHTVEGPTTLAYVLVAVGVCIALIFAGYLGARLALRRPPAQVG